MRSSFKSVIMCSALLAASGLALGQNTADPKKPAAPAHAPATPPKDAKPATPPAPGGMDPMMEAMMKAGTPGAEHKKLEPMAGSFNVECKFVMGPPGTPETVSKGTAVNAWVLDGRFLQMTYQGDMMGMPFHGMGFMGYNNVSKQFESYWIDSMVTGMSMSTGTASADSKTFTWSGECDDPMTGKKKMSRSVNKIIDANTYTMEMFEAGPDGKDMKVGTLTFTRSGAAPAKPAAPTNTTPAKPK